MFVTWTAIYLQWMLQIGGFISLTERILHHRDAMEANRLATSMKTAKLMATSKSEMAVTAAMKNVYFMAKKNMPSSLVPELNKLCIMQGNTTLKDLKVDSHTTYEHNTSINDFQDCMATVLTEEIVGKIKHFNKFSIMIDESTDVSVKQNLVTYIRVLETDEYRNAVPCTYFLGVSDLQRANAQSIFDKLKGCLQDKGISMNGLCSVSTDGAAVMVGSKSGVVTRLKEYVPGVIATHCIAHRLALSCAAAADTISLSSIKK